MSHDLASLRKIAETAPEGPARELAGSMYHHAMQAMYERGDLVPAPKGPDLPERIWARKEHDNDCGQLWEDADYDTGGVEYIRADIARRFPVEGSKVPGGPLPGTWMRLDSPGTYHHYPLPDVGMRALVQRAVDLIEGDLVGPDWRRACQTFLAAAWPVLRNTNPD